MAEKLDTTPDGIVCKVCGDDKPAYHYFKHAGKYTQDFFTTELGYTPGVCWECAGDYRCITCHEVKPASEFRVQGRICTACKTAVETSNAAQMRVSDNKKVSVVLDALKTLKSDEMDES